MNDIEKTKEQLLIENEQLNAKIAELNQSLNKKHTPDQEVKSIEDQQNLSENKYRLMFDNMINGIAYHKIVTDNKGNPVDYIFLEVNDAFEELTGLKAKKIIDKRVTEVLPGIEKDPTNWIGLYGKVALNNKSVQFESYSETLNKWYSINAYCPEKGYFITIFEDITNRKSTENIQKENETLLKTITENFPNTFISIIEKDFTVGFSSGQEFKKLNLNPDDFFGLTIEQVFGEHSEVVKQNYIKTFKGEETTFELIINKHHQLYKTFPIIAPDGSIYRILAFVQNITEQKNTVNKIKEQQRLLNKVGEIAKIGGWEMDLNNDGKASWTKGTYDIVEIDPKEPVPGFNEHLEYYFPEYREMIKKEMNDLIENQKPIKFIAKAKTKKRKIIWVEALAEAVVENKKVVKIRGTLQDITEFKTTESDLIESEKRLVDAQKMAKLGFWDWKIKTGEVKWSDEVYKIFKLEPENFTPNIDSIMELSPWPEENKRDKEIIQKAIESHDPGNYEQKFLRPDGSMGYYFSTFQGEYDNNDELVSMKGTIQDITDRKLAQIAILESEEKFRSLFEFSPLGKSMTGIGGSLQVNKAFCEMVGYSQDELKVKNWKEITHPDDLQESIDVVQNLIDGKENRAQYEKRYIHKNGDIVWTEVQTALKRDHNNNPEFFITTISDITERKRSEEKIKRFSRIFEDSLNEIFLFDAETLKFTQVNKAAQKNLGYTMEELYEFSPLDIKPEFNPETFDELVAPLQKGEKNEIVFETVHQRKNKSIYNVEVHLQYLKYEQKSLFAAIIIDITERKKAEYALVASEEKFRKLFQSTPLALVNVDKDGVFTLRNDRFIEIFGYTEADIHNINDWWLKAYPDKKYREWAIQNWESAVLKASETGNDIKSDEYLVTCKDGGVRNVIISGVTVKDDLLATLYDITERKKSENALRESEEKFRNLSQISPVGIFVTDKDGNTTYWNERLCEITGMSKIEGQGKGWLDGIHPDDKERVFAEWYKSTEARAKFRMDYRFIDRKGNVTFTIAQAVPMKNAQGELIGFVGSITDISELKQAERELRESQDFFEQLYIQSSMSTQLLDKEGWCVRINPKLSELFGVKPEDIEGKKYNILHDDEIIRTGVIDYLKRVFDHKETMRWEVNFDIQHASESTSVEVSNPTKKWFANLAYPILNEEGELKYVIVQHDDITKRKQVEEEIETHREHLEELVKARTKDLEIKNKELDGAMKVFVGRELAIRNLQERIRAFERK